MPAFFNIFYTNLIGIVRLFIPVGIAYAVAPQFAFSPVGIVLISGSLAFYCAMTIYQASTKEAQTLVYVPSEDVLASLQAEVIKAGFKPNEIGIGYTYLFDQVAQSLFTTVKIDPLLWKNCDHDPVKQKIVSVLDAHVLHHVSADKKAFINQLNTLLTPEAQLFIFRHELGHIASQDSIKRIVSVGAIVMATTAAAMTVVTLSAPVIGLVSAAMIALVAGCIVDIILTAAQNRFIKAAQEKKADEFAAHMSSFEQTVAAAQFFKAYDQAMSHLTQTDTVLSVLGLPSTYARGYYSGKDRSAYLIELAHKLK